MLYFLHDKTQEEVAEIMGINRLVVSQHLFGIRRNGRQVGGAPSPACGPCAGSGESLPMFNW